MTNSILGILIILGIGGALTTMIVGIIMAAQRKWRGAAACLILFFVSLGLFGGMTAWWVTRVVSTVKSSIAVAEANEAALEVRREAARNAAKALTPAVNWSEVDADFWENDGTANHDRLPVRYPYEIDSSDAMDSGSLFRNIAGGKSSDHATQCKAVGPKDIVEFAADGNLFVYRSEDGRKMESFGLFIFDKDEKLDFRSTTAMWVEARKRGWKGKEELQSLDERNSQYWSGE